MSPACAIWCPLRLHGRPYVGFEGITDFEAYRALVRGEEARLAYESGDWSKGILSLGPAVSFADQIEPAASILARLMNEATTASSRVADLQTNKSIATGVGS